MADGPRLEEMEASARAIGKAIGESLAASHGEGAPKIGFALLVFTMENDDAAHEWMTYVSNAEREDMLDAMREFIRKHEENEPDLEILP